MVPSSTRRTLCTSAPVILRTRSTVPRVQGDICGSRDTWDLFDAYKVPLLPALDSRQQEPWIPAPIRAPRQKPPHSALRELVADVCKVPVGLPLVRSRQHELWMIKKLKPQPLRSAWLMQPVSSCAHSKRAHSKRGHWKPRWMATADDHGFAKMDGWRRWMATACAHS